jgi:hypothetical protein
VKLVTKRGYEVGGEHYKRVPRGFDPKQPNADLLRYAGLYAGVGFAKVPPEFFSAKLVDLCFKHCKGVLPLHQWLTAFVERQG